MMRLTIDYLALGILLATLLIVGLLKIFLFPKSITPSLRFSRVADLKNSSWRPHLISFLPKLHLAALVCLMIAFIDPHLLFPKPSVSNRSEQAPRELPTEGLAIYLILDRSGSMAQPISTIGENGTQESISKIDLLKRVTRQFIIHHPSDLIGLISFARVPKVLVPLTLDQEALLKNLNQIEVVKKPVNDGTAIGYAIFKTANLIAATRYFAQDLRKEGAPPPFTIKSAIMIVVTDGFQNPSRLDQGNRLRTMELDDAAAYAKSQNIRLYIINIDPALSTSQYAPQRRQLQAVTSLTEGKYYFVNDNQELQDIYTDINRLEKGKIMREGNLQTKGSHKTAYTRFSFYPLFILLGLGCLLAALILDTMVLRTIP